MVPSLPYGVIFLLGLYFYSFLTRRRKNRFYVISIIFVVLSLFSKESGVFYLITYSAVIWFFFKKEVNKLQK